MRPASPGMISRRRRLRKWRNRAGRSRRRSRAICGRRAESAGEDLISTISTSPSRVDRDDVGAAPVDQRAVRSRWKSRAPSGAAARRARSSAPSRTGGRRPGERAARRPWVTRPSRRRGSFAPPSRRSSSSANSVLPEVIRGMTEASTTVSPSSPSTRSRSSTTAAGSSARPIFAVPTGWKIVVPMSPAAFGEIIVVRSRARRASAPRANSAPAPARRRDAARGGSNRTATRRSSIVAR